MITPCHDVFLANWKGFPELSRSAGVGSCQRPWRGVLARPQLPHNERAVPGVLMVHTPLHPPRLRPGVGPRHAEPVARHAAASAAFADGAVLGRTRQHGPRQRAARK